MVRFLTYFGLLCVCVSPRTHTNPGVQTNCFVLLNRIVPHVYCCSLLCSQCARYEKVSPVSALCMFDPQELHTMLFGESVLEFTKVISNAHSATTHISWPHPRTGCHCTWLGPRTLNRCYVRCAEIALRKSQTLWKNRQQQRPSL